MIVGVTCWRGLGATTTSLALAASLALRGARPWLVEADPAGGVLAARLPRSTLASGALEVVALPERRSGVVERFHDVAVDTAGMRIVSGAGDPFRAWACHEPRQPWAPALRGLDGPVVVDLGRLRGGSPVGAVVDQLDAVLVVSDADAVSIATTLEWVEAHGRVATADTAMPVDRSYCCVIDAPTALDRAGKVDVLTALGDRCIGWLPWDVDAVRALHDLVPLDDRRMRRSTFVQGVHHLAEQLVARTGTEVAA